MCLEIKANRLQWKFITFSLQTIFLGGESVSGGSYANYCSKIRTVYLIMEFIQQILQSMQTSTWNVLKGMHSEEEPINETLLVEQSYGSQSNDRQLNIYT